MDLLFNGLAHGRYLKTISESHHYPDWTGRHEGEPRLAGLSLSLIHDTPASDHNIVRELSGPNLESDFPPDSDSPSLKMYTTTIPSHDFFPPQYSQITSVHKHPLSNGLKDQSWQNTPQNLDSSSHRRSSGLNSLSILPKAQENRWIDHLDGAGVHHPREMYDSSFLGRMETSRDLVYKPYTGSVVSDPLSPAHSEGSPLTFSNTHYPFNSMNYFSSTLQFENSFREGHVEHLHQYEENKHIDSRIHFNHPNNLSPPRTSGWDGT